MVLLNKRKNTCRKQRVDMFLLTVDRNDWRKKSPLWNSCCEFFSQPKLLMSEWVGAVTCEQGLLFGRAKRVSRLRANEWWSCEGPRTPFLGPSLARSRGARFGHVNRRACSQAIGAAAWWCNNYILTTKTERGSEWRFGREEGGRFYPLLTC